MKIKMQGYRSLDDTQAFNASKIPREAAGDYTWHHMSDFDPKTGDVTMQLVKRDKVRRQLYNKVVRMSKFPNFKSSQLLALLLNVMGIRYQKATSDRPISPLHKAVLSWVKQNYVRLAEQSPRVAGDCLPEGITYDPDGPRLVMTGIAILDRAPSHIILDLNPRIQQ
ncbi:MULTISPECIES: HNH endonuclease [Burkholderia]|uniref:HNH endonuclease n=1 Tax=Burkholderia TaxID=32008 RepID=UPI00126A1894|nr:MULTISPECIES: HNH endonuclease [Burkholderia]